MKDLHVSVRDKVATYSERDGKVVCGNTDYQIVFTFDSEWDAYPEKTARFIWNGEYLDVPFTGNVCTMPMVYDTFTCLIGVYVKDFETTTPARIECLKSILCVESVKNNESNKIYADEAKDSADTATLAAQWAGYFAGRAEQAAENAESNVTTALAEAKASGEFDGLTPYIGENGTWWIGDEDTGVAAGGIGGGGNGSGGGGNTNNAVLTVRNTTGWIAKAIAEGADCFLSVRWTSIEDGLSTGNGILTLSIDGAVKTSYEVTQGDHSVNVGKYLTTGMNKVVIEIADAYSNTRIISYSINCVSVGISSYFDGTIARTGSIPYAYTPVGAVEKVVHFLIDGDEIGTQTVTVSGREQTYNIPAQSHGSHTFEVYFTANIDGHDVESNRLYYDLITYVDGNTTPIISVPFNVASVKQYSTVAIPYIVYTPDIITSAVALKDGTNVVANLTVDRTQQIWSYKALNSGTADLSIVCGDVVKPITFEVTPNEMDVSAETENLELYLTSEGRSNNEENPLVWKSGAVEAELTGFNLTSDGWQLDEENNTVLRVSGDARVHIPFNIFGTDFRGTGKTIEVEFATRDVLNYDAVILSTWSGERGIKITAQKALLKSEQSEIFTQYKEDETVRVAFTIEKRAENRLLAIYLNGIMSGVIQYPDDDDFSQVEPVGISIGSDECTTDIYCIRVYSNNLTRYQILNNWIADTQDVEQMVDRYTRNNVFDDYGNIVASKIPTTLPYMVLNVSRYADLPQSKGDKKTVSGSYIDPLNPSRSFTFNGAEIDVQGTSSADYSRKNYKVKFKNGFVIGGETQTGYQLRPHSMPTNIFTFKADVASSEGANNVELVRLYDDTCPVKTPPQMADSRVRQGIDGYPIIMFYGSGNNLTFIGKYNFNNDKATPEVFGFGENDESWEILLNNTDMAVWKDDDFTGDNWKTTFEGRHPDKNTDTTRLAAFASWLKSTDTTAVTSEAEKVARLQKFKDEFAEWCNVDAMIFNYIFTETFLMTDNRAKNAFPTRYDADGKWLILPYDFDTAIGINNMGELKFGYELEDTDIVDGRKVFNGQDSVLYVNMRLAFKDEIMEMYQDLRNGKVFSYEEIERRFEEHQNVWGEAIFNEDARFKYIEPLVNDGDGSYLPMLQGSKAEQRKWWLYNRFRYLDSKYVAGDSKADVISMRAYSVDDIKVKPYADIYATAEYDSVIVQARALRGQGDEDGFYTLANPLGAGNEADIDIYSASQLSDIGDLSGLKLGQANFSKAVKLSALKIGDGAADYENPILTDLTVGNLVLLRTLDVRNCSALTKPVDVSGCTNIEHVFFDGTATTGVTLPNGGILKTLHLPSTVTNLTILNQKQITDFVLPSYANISTLRIENTPIVNTLAALNAIAANSRVRLVGVDWSFETPTEVLALMDKLDTFRGLDEAGNNQDKAVVSGVIHIPALTREQLDEMNRRYPNITIDYDALTVRVQFINGETVVSETYVASGAAITKPADPADYSDSNYKYKFKGWSLDGENVADVTVAGNMNMTFYALYDAKRKVTVYLYLDGEPNSSYSAVEGEPISYPGLRKKTTPQYIYTITGWSYDGVNALEDLGVAGSEDIVLYAIFTKELRYYNIRFLNGSTVLQAGLWAYGDTPAYLGADPVPEEDYIFIGWTPDISIVTGDMDYVAKFKSTASVARKIVDRTVTSVESDAVTSVGEYAFYKCDTLTSVNMPNATSVGNYAFQDCTRLASANLQNVVNIGNSSFHTCGLTSIYLPNVTTIDGYAFNSNKSLTSVDLPSVTSIGNNAFFNCKKLNSVCLPAEPPTLSNVNTFGDIDSSCVFSIPIGSLSAYQSATNWSSLTSTYSFVEEDRT